MRSLALVVPRAEGESTRRALAVAGLLREDLEIAAGPTEVAIPLLRPPPELPPRGRVEEREFETRGVRPDRSYSDGLELTPALRALLPRSFDIVGDVVLVRVEPALAEHEPAIGAALLRFVPGARLVAADEGVHGEARLRSLRTLAGTGGLRTVHRENGLSFEVDLERAYFSPRLGREHARVASAGRAGETVLDLCCGVGPFGLTLLLRGGAARATLVDANPAAVELARANARRLRVEGRADVREARIEAFLAGGTTADRVVFNLPREGIKYLAQVGSAVAGGGTLHYYEIMERSAAADRLEAVVADLPGASGWRLAEHHVVHPYSPTADLVALTLTRGDR